MLSTEAGAGGVPDAVGSPVLGEDGQGFSGTGVLGEFVLQPVRCLDQIRGVPGLSGLDPLEKRPLDQTAFGQIVPLKDRCDPPGPVGERLARAERCGPVVQVADHGGVGHRWVGITKDDNENVALIRISDL